MREKYLIVLKRMAAACMAVQILLGAAWALCNCRAVPEFGDTAEYLMLSETLYLDEYRPVLFPLLLRGIQRIASVCGLPYQCLLYAGQAALNAGAIWLTVRTVFALAGIRAGKGIRALTALYIFSIPLILWMNFSVLTDSLALSALLLMLNGLIWYMSDRGHPAGNWLLIGAAYVCQALLRADRQYSCLVLLILCVAAKAFRGRKEKKTASLRERGQRCACGLLLPAVVILTGLGTVRLVNAHTQIPGANGRIRTNLSFILLDRVVYGHFAENYDRMPEEATAVISLEEAQHSDRQNNDCMYILAPRLEEAYGRERAAGLEREMARVVWERSPGTVMGDILEDIFCFVCMPFASFLFEIGAADLNKAWTIRCMSSVSGTLTQGMHSWFAYTFGLGMSLLLPLLYLRRREAAKRAACLGSCIAMTILIALWFGIGDGCPPNDRYQLIGYVTWALLAANALL